MVTLNELKSFKTVMLPTWNAKPEFRPHFTGIGEYLASILQNVFSEVSKKN
jgi:hypothetical protein